jgi:tRNA(Ile)-lysidine synthase
MPFSAAQLLQLLARVELPVQRLWVAYSGGVDSHVLLHRCLALHEELPEIAGAIHVHHGLSQNADTWQQHCQMVCEQVDLVCHISRVEVAEGEGLEDKARRVRYAAIKAYLQPGDAVLFAQHQDDQAETLLLQALRGGGPRGLAAMPAVATLGDGYMIRPMLAVSRQQILDYANKHELRWIEDDSNRDIRFDRNFIRQEIMPVLNQRWPAASRTLSRTASHTAGLVELTDELLLDELQGLAGNQPDTLSINALKAVSTVKASLLIRAMCYKLALPLPATAHIRELLDKQLHTQTDRQIHINWPGAEIRRYQDDLYILASSPLIVDSQWQYDWDGKGLLEIPELYGNIRLEETQGSGISSEAIQQGLTIKPRSGGERCKPAGDSHTRSLKTIYQDHHVPPWEREKLPLIFSNDTLIAIADIVVCDQAAVSGDSAGFKIIWQSIH